MPRSVSLVRLSLIVLCLGGCRRAASTPGQSTTPAPSAVTDGRSLFTDMQRHYKRSWFSTLSFLQNNTLYGASGTQTKSQWREYIAVPGRLRIDYMPLAAKSGVLYESSKVHVFQNGSLTDSRAGVHPLLILAADVYVRPPDSSARLLDSLGFQTAVVRRGKWQERPVWVVGAAEGDTTSSQFWVDEDRMVVVRVIQKERRGARDVVTDVHFNRYTDFGGWPIAIEVLRHRDGRLVFREDYADVKVDGAIPDAVFDPARWKDAQVVP